MKKAYVISLILFALVGLVSCGEVPGQPPIAQDPPQQGSGPSSLPPAPSSPPPQGEIVLQETFDVLGENWAVLDTEQVPGEQSYWYAEAGVLVQGGTTMDMDSVDPGYLIVSVADWTDYTVRANIYVETNDEVGLIFRVNQDGFYRFRMRSAEFDGPYNMGLDLYQEERYTVLWHDLGEGFPLEQWFTLEIKVTGGTFTVSMDGQEIAVVQDTTFPTGGIGVFAWSERGAYFDNVMVAR
jgi:hypothetical protein